MESITDINIQLKLGKLPDSLNYAPRPREEIDWAKVAYNSFYKTREFQLSRIPNPMGFLNLPGGTQIIESMAANAKSPLEELNFRQEYSHVLETLDE